MVKVKTEFGTIECTTEEYEKLLSSGLIRHSEGNNAGKKRRAELKEGKKNMQRDYLEELVQFLAKNKSKFYTKNYLMPLLNLPKGFFSKMENLIIQDDRIIVRKVRLSTHYFYNTLDLECGAGNITLHSKGVLPNTRQKYYARLSGKQRHTEKEEPQQDAEEDSFDPLIPDTATEQKQKAKRTTSEYQKAIGVIQGHRISVLKEAIPIGEMTRTTHRFLSEYKDALREKRITPKQVLDIYIARNKEGE